MKKNSIGYSIASIGYLLFVSVFCFLAGVSSLEARKLGFIELTCSRISPIEQSYLERHVNFSRESKKLETRVIDQFVKKLDPSKVYLLAADIKTIKKNMKGIFVNAKKKDCSSIVKAHSVLKDRINERVAFIKGYINKGFVFDKKTQLLLDPTKRKHHKNLKSAQAFHRKYVQFQVGNYLATDMKMKEAKEHVIRGYERMKRRMTEFKQTDLWSMYLDSFARSLDPHSSYLSHDALEDFEIQMRLSLEGIGATLSSSDGFTVIEQLIPGGAAFKSGKLKTKDKIVAVAQGKKGKFENVIEMDLRDVVRKIRGPKGSLVRLTLLRKGEKSTDRLSVSLVRAKIKLEEDAVSITYLEKKWKGKPYRVGLVDIPSFYADSRRGGRSSAKDLRRVLAEAKTKNVSSIVLDLSTNGGGSLDDAVKIAGLFFKVGNVVKQSHRAPGRPETPLADVDPEVNYSGPMVVLTSRLSASASEIVAGTLKDYRRAVVVGGDHTFGKGSVQQVEPMPRGLGAIKTTVGMFFTPGGHSTQHRGVDADIVFPSSYSTPEIGEKTLDYSLPPKKISAFLSAEAAVTSGDSQWNLITSATIKKLGAKSKVRVKTDKGFKKVVKAIKEAAAKKKKGSLFKVASIFEREEKKKQEKKKAKASKKLKMSKIEDGHLEGMNPVEKAKAKAKSSNEDENRYLTAEEKQKKYLERADIREAVNVALDLAIAMNAKPVMTLGSKSSVPGKESIKN